LTVSGRYIEGASSGSYRVCGAELSELRRGSIRSRDRSAVSGFGLPIVPSSLGLLTRSRCTPKDFADFYIYNAPTVLGYLARHTQDPQVAFDITAEVFARAYEKRENCEGTTTEQAGAWLWKIVRNELSRYQTKRSVEFAALKRLGHERPMPSDHELREVERLLALEGIVREHIPEALDLLSAEHQEVLQLRYFEELSNEEIAVRLSVSNAVVRRRISRALRILERNTRLRSAVDTLADT
jgi:RNA polymerase sigma factor (sigma-70 family)